MENFATIVRPLNELLHKVTEEDEGAGLKMKKGGIRRKGEFVQDQWTHSCEEAFKKLKKNLTEAPVLAYADPSLQYEL